jgi:hypothetical protein
MRGDSTPLYRATLAALALLAAHPAAGQSRIAEYRASYEVRHDGRRAATAEFSVIAADDGEYVYRSVTEARGLLKLVAPDPATEESRLRLAGSELVSLLFDYVDGSRKGEDNFSIAFDSASGQIHITGPDGATTLPWERGLLDRGSLQVAVMRDLADCRLPGTYRWVDEDGIKVYRYERLDDAEAETGAGDFATLRFRQQREGSSRQSILWLAPSLSYVPVIVEQIDDGETETVFNLSDITVTTPPTPTCSGFR